MTTAEIQRGELNFLEPEKIGVIVTYSMAPNLEPSRLSLMAADAAFFTGAAEQLERLLIAGEQSYQHYHRTTGDLLAALAPEGSPPISVLREDNRLLNTPFQAEKLAEVLKEDQKVTVIGWGFHEQRVIENITAHSLQELNITYVKAEDVIEWMWQTADLWNGDHEAKEQAFKERYGFEVDWPTVKLALAEFEKREKRTRLAHKFGKTGWVIKLLTTFRKAGRYDDISPVGIPITDTTH